MTLYYSQEGTKCRVAISFFPRNMLRSDLSSFYIKLSRITITTPAELRKPEAAQMRQNFYCILMSDEATGNW